MRVGLLAHGDLAARSGPNEYDRLLVAGLRATGDDVEVFSLPRRPYRRALAGNLSRSLPRRVRRADLDVLVQDERCHPALAWLNGRLDDATPVVALVHRLRSEEGWTDWRDHLYRRVERRYLRGVDAFVCTSEATRGTVAELADPAPSVVAPPGGDRFERSLTRATVRERAHGGPLRVAFVGAVARRNGLDTLVEGLERVSGDWRLAVVGDPEADPEYAALVRRRVDALDVADRVSFWGSLTDDDLADVLAASHLTATPARHGGFSLAALDGMAFGLPAVLTSGGAATELVSHRENGLLVDPEDPSAIIDAVAPLCRNRVRLAGMGVRALDTSRAHPTWAETTERVRAFLRAVVADEDPAGGPTDRTDGADEVGETGEDGDNRADDVDGERAERVTGRGR